MSYASSHPGTSVQVPSDATLLTAVTPYQEVQMRYTSEVPHLYLGGYLATTSEVPHHYLLTWEEVPPKPNEVPPQPKEVPRRYLYLGGKRGKIGPNTEVIPKR